MSNSNMADFYADIASAATTPQGQPEQQVSSTQSAPIDQSAQIEPPVQQIEQPNESTQTQQPNTSVQDPNTPPQVEPKTTIEPNLDNDIEKLLAEIEAENEKTKTTPPIKKPEMSSKIEQQNIDKDDKIIKVADENENEANDNKELLAKNKQLQSMIDEMITDNKALEERVSRKIKREFESEIESLKDQLSSYRKKAGNFFEKYQSAMYDEKRIAVPEELLPLTRLQQEYISSADEKVKKMIKDKYDAELLLLAEKNFGRPLDNYVRDAYALGGDVNIPESMAQYNTPKPKQTKDTNTNPMLDYF